MADSSTQIPQHVAFIMDGNGRWAKARGLSRLKGHEAGAETVRRVIRYCREKGIRYLTLYAFSTENWRRPVLEVSGLMKLLTQFLAHNERELHEHRVRLRVIGRRADLPAAVQRDLARVETATAAYDQGQLILALSYGGRAELAAAARQIATEVAAGTLRPEAVNEKTVAARLYAPDIPDPDLVVRTSGEFRVSNFLLWQAAYSEWVVTPVLWPDFEEVHFNEVVAVYAKRQRRFGGIDIEVEERASHD